MAKILLIEDDDFLAHTVQLWLAHNKYAVDVAMTGAVALEKLSSESFDIILMDWDLPDITGIEICKQYRLAGGKTPILMLSGNDTDASKQGLDAGANDYMKKPFDLHALVERISNLAPVS